MKTSIHRYVSIVFVLAIAVTLTQCSHTEELQKNAKFSKTGEDESHNFMQDCMRCHNDNGNEAAGFGGGWWNIAGSVLDDDGEGHAKRGHIELWSGPDRTGTKYLDLDIDDEGNFYTGRIVDYNGSCYPVLVNENGNYVAMSSPFTGGGCNGCHNDDTTSKLQLP